MDKKEFLKTIREAKKNSPKRKFIQSVDLVFNLKAIDPKKQPVDSYVTLPHQGKKTKICALVDKALESQSKEIFNKIILKDEFPKLKKDKKEIKRLSKEYDVFLAQAEIMPQIATTFGQVLGPKGKMPSPKAGAVVPGKIPSLKPVYEKLSKTVRLSTKNNSTLKCSLGKESLTDEELSDNAFTIYQSIIHVLPQEVQNIKNIMIKLTMGPSFMVGKAKEQKE